MQLWQNKEIFSINTLKPTALSFSNIEGSYRSLNGKWKFLFLDSVNYVPEGWYEEGFDLSDFTEIAVPSNWQLQGFGRPNYSNYRYPYAIESQDRKAIPSINDDLNPVGLYATTFELDTVENKTILTFGGINSCGIIYLNGQFVGYSEDSFDERNYDVTPYVRQGENTLKVQVMQFCTGSYLEDQDMWRISGIFRDVTLCQLSNGYIADFWYETKLSPKMDKGTINATLSVNNNSIAKSFDIECLVLDGKSKVAEYKTTTSIDENQTKELNFTFSEIDKLKLWSDETPNLYCLYVKLFCDKKLIDQRTIKVGFRQISIDKSGKQPILMLNGKPIIFYGVNRHEFYPTVGHAVTKQQILDDLILLKQNNVNAIRTCHYPNQRYFYELCDELGFLVICENNLETHGLAKIIPSNDPIWTKHCLYRIDSMVGSFRNHPSIVCWSLGNESGVGSSFVEMRKQILKTDTTRIIHYEPMYSVSDLLSQMYTVQPKLKKIAKNRTIIHSRAFWNNMMGNFLPSFLYKDKPYIECEYAHCMGNSLGNFKEYVEDFRKYPRLAGGFIWDFADQSIKRENPKTGKTEWTFGGDFNDLPNDGEFAFNGIVRADRSPNPALFEVKQMYAKISCRLEGKVLIVQNWHSFSTLNNVYAVATLLIQGKAHVSETLVLQNINPLTEEEITLSDRLFSTIEDSILTIEFKQKQATAYSPKDYSICFFQFQLQAWKAPQESLITGANHTIENDSIIISTQKVTYTVSKQSGYIVSAIVDGKQALNAPIRPNFWRPFTNNDKYPPNDIADLVKLLNLDAYRNAMQKLHPRRVSISTEDGIVRLTINWKMPYVMGLTTQYSFSGDGKLGLSLTVTPLKPMVKYGFNFQAAIDSDEMKLYGRGPCETMRDRYDGGMLKIHHGKVDDFMHEYLYPQECGNHIQTRFVSVGDKTGVYCTALSHPLEVSVRKYSIEDLDRSKHLHELTPLENCVEINLDGAQRGVGGDIPAMACTKKAYKLPAFKTYYISSEITFN